MADDSPPPLPPAVPTDLPPPVPRPPVPGWMWALCGLGMSPVGALLCAASVNSQNPNQTGAALAVGGIIGLILGLPMLGGLGLAARFYSGITGRLLGALMFGTVIVVGLGAVAFAGCMCLLSGQSFH